MADYKPFHPEPRKPSKMPPPLTCDSQFHVLGDPETYPTRPGAAYHMPSATWERALHMHRQLGIERGVIVQTTTYGADHSVVLDGLASMGPNYKGCANALVFAEKDDAYLETMNAAGINGARFSFRQALGAVLDDAAFDAAVGKLRDLGWYMKVQPEQTGIADSVGKLDGVDIPVLIDHMGRPDAAKGADDVNITALKKLLDRGNFWVMLSLGEKISKTGAPWDDVVPLAQALIAHAPERCVWASDWPHPVSPKQPPNDAELLELFYRYAPDEAVQKQILVDNPAKLFGF
ncbi:amidohydrolase family protein [Arenibacterium halophilum]|uniref:2-pyrone-4,6-dicarboxylate hydrolase n=1 Tax=Arenibacterium halophilum TaxID=2583821 RepID=A0ABY2X9F6_9RHOB|nr:amidohydrolase family protein [Arenibacterium halophilum]TMV12655.1 2-pyrone-4,6-dicarboxylate hydrolase [Arenibacterium halophilum]